MVSSSYAGSSGQRASSPCCWSVPDEHIAHERTELSASIIKDDDLNAGWEVLVDVREAFFSSMSPPMCFSPDGRMVKEKVRGYTRGGKMRATYKVFVRTAPIEAAGYSLWVLAKICSKFTVDSILGGCSMRSS